MTNQLPHLVAWIKPPSGYTTETHSQIRGFLTLPWTGILIKQQLRPWGIFSLNSVLEKGKVLSQNYECRLILFRVHPWGERNVTQSTPFIFLFRLILFTELRHVRRDTTKERRVAVRSSKTYGWTMKNKGVKENKLSNPQVRPTIIQSVSLCSMNTTIPVELQFLNTDFFWYHRNWITNQSSKLFHIFVQQKV